MHHLFLYLTVCYISLYVECVFAICQLKYLLTYFSAHKQANDAYSDQNDTFVCLSVFVISQNYTCIHGLTQLL